MYVSFHKRLQSRNECGEWPNPTRYLSSHRRRHSQRRMHAAESIVREVQSASRVASEFCARRAAGACGTLIAPSSTLQKDVTLRLMLTGNTREANSSHLSP